MIVYYALGGGLGHVTRGRAVIHTLGLEGPVTVVTSSPGAADRRIVGDWNVVQLEGIRTAAALRESVVEILDEQRPHTIFVDAFPGGILGELGPGLWPNGCDAFHVARALRWHRYTERLRGPLPEYRKVFGVEALGPQQLEALGGTVEKLILLDPPMRGTVPDVTGAWLIVHAGAEEEILDLVAYARERRDRDDPDSPLVLLSPHRPSALAPDINYLDHYPARQLFKDAARIVTACGFNSMRQTESFAEKHLSMPFERALDDQFSRAAQRRADQRRATGSRMDGVVGSARRR